MPDIGASGIMGIALETVPNTFVVPTKYFPFDSENLNLQQDTIWRRPIRNTPGLIAAVPGNIHTEGEITMAALSDVIPYFLMASRCTVVKSGTTPNWIYTATPSPVATPAKTMSIAIKRGAEVFGYTGCVVGNFTFTIDDNGLLQFNVGIVGSDEATTGALTATWPTTTPYGAGMYSIQIPSASQIFDADGFEFKSEDNAEAQFRIKTTRGAQFIKFGESEATLKLNRDFSNRTEYDAFKALTSQAITLLASKSINESIQIDMPVAFKDDYQIAMPGQGDLIRAEISYQGAIDGTGKHYQIVVKTAENIT